MKTLTKAVLFLALAIAASASTLYTVGFEDLSGPTSDRDFNDTVFNVRGLTFDTVGVWTQPDPPPYGEMPFPFSSGFYFNGATATGNLVYAFMFQQSALASVETAYVRVGTGPWVPITSSSELALPASAGDQVSFKLQSGPTTYYPKASDNGDGLSHAVVASAAPDPQGDVPEPTTPILIGAGLVLVALIGRRHAKSRAVGNR